MNILYVDKRVPFFQEVLGTKSGLDLECCSTDLQTGVHVLSFCDPGFHGKNISLQRKDPASPTLETSAWDGRCHQLTHGPVKLPSWGEGIQNRQDIRRGLATEPTVQTQPTRGPRMENRPKGSHSSLASLPKKSPRALRSMFCKSLFRPAPAAGPCLGLSFC